MIGFSACFNPFVRVHPYGSCAVEQLFDLLRRDIIGQHLIDVLRLDAVVGGNGFQSSMWLAFERIHPFQDGNGRVGRLILFKECLKHNIVPFIIEDNLKLFYYRGLKEWDREKGWLMDTCLTAQDRFKAYLDYFRIEY